MDEIIFAVNIFCKKNDLTFIIFVFSISFCIFTVYLLGTLE
jgi:hypothetical protein